MQPIHGALTEAAKLSPSTGFHAGPGYYALWVVGIALVITIIYFVVRSVRKSTARSREH
jgi:hypothetical protein